MASIEDIRRLYPDQTADKSDADIIQDLSAQTRLDPTYVAGRLGVQVNDPGFWSGVRQGLGGFTEGVGRTIDDMTDDRPGAITRYGRDVQFRNPSSAASQSWEGFKESPWQGVKELAGQGIGSTLPSIAAFAIPGGQGAGAAGLVGRGLQTARAIGTSGAAQTALAAAPIYGQVRNEQQQADEYTGGAEDKLRAAAAALGGGWVESKLGVNRLLNQNAGMGVRAAERQALVDSFSATPWKTARNTMGRSALEEGAEEIVQQPMQQWGAYQDPTTEESIRDTMWAGFGGVVGGLAMAPIGGMKMGLAHSKIDQFRQQDLLRPDTQLSTLEDQAQWNRAFVNRDQGIAAGDMFYNGQQGTIDNYLEGLSDDYRRQAFADQMQQVDNYEIARQLRNLRVGPNPTAQFAQDIGTGIYDQANRVPNAYGPTLTSYTPGRTQNGYRLTPEGQAYADFWANQLYDQGGVPQTQGALQAQMGATPDMFGGLESFGNEGAYSPVNPTAPMPANNRQGSFLDQLDLTLQPGYAPQQTANDLSVGLPASLNAQRSANSGLSKDGTVSTVAPTGGFGVSGTLANLDAASVQQLVPFLQNGGAPAFQQLAGTALSSGRNDLAQKVATAWSIAQQFKNDRIATVQGRPVAAKPAQVAPQASQAKSAKAQPKPAAAPAAKVAQPKPVRAAGKAAQKFEADLAAEMEKNQDDADLQKIHAEWNNGLSKTKQRADDLRKQMNTRGENIPVETAEQALARKAAEEKAKFDAMTDDEKVSAGFVKVVRPKYERSTDPKTGELVRTQTGETVEWVKAEAKQKRQTKDAEASVAKVEPEAIEDEQHRDMVERFINGDSQRALSERYGLSHESVRQTLLGYGYTAKNTKDDAGNTGSATSEVTPEDEAAANEAFAGAETQGADDEHVDHSLENQGITVRKAMDSGAAVSATNDAKTERDIAKLNADEKKQHQKVQKEAKKREPTSDRKAREAAEAKQLAEETDALDAAVEQVLQGDLSVAPGMLVALSGPHGQILKQRLKTLFGMPTALNEAKDIVGYLVPVAQARKAEVKALVSEAAAAYGEGFDKLDAEQQHVFAMSWDQIGGKEADDRIVRKLKEQFNGQQVSGESGEAAARDAGRDVVGLPGDRQNDQGAETSQQSESGVRVERKKTRRLAKPDEAAGRSNTEAQAGEVGAPLHRRESLTFTDSTGDKITEEVEWLDEANYPDVTDVLDAVEEGPLAGTLDNVEGFYISHNGDAYAYKNPDGTFKIVLPFNALSGNPELLGEIVHHELAHVADDADAHTGGVNSAGVVMGVMAQKAKALYDRLPADSKLRKLLDYPFNAKYPESKSAKLIRAELYAQLVAARLNPALAAELKAASPALYNFAETIVNEIEEQYQAQSEGTVSGVRDAEIVHTGPAPVFRRGEKTATQRVQDVAGATGVRMMDDAGGVVSRAFKWFMSLHDLVGEYGHVLPSAQKWYDSVRAAIATRKQMESDAEEIAARAGKLKPALLKQLNEFISRSTFEQKWGYDATFDAMDGSKRQVKADGEMAKLFNALPQEARDIAKEVFAHGEAMKLQKFKIMKELGLSGVLNQTGSLQGPYAPLKRFGDYVAVLKSKELRAAEAANDTKLTEKLKADPDHYMVSNFDTLGQARQFARANEATYGWSDAFKGSVRFDDGRQMKPETLQKVLAAIKADNLPASVKGQVESLVRDMYLQAFDEHNARMSGLKRKNRAGYDADMIRSFLSHARAEAGFLANMKHGGTTNEMFYKMQQEAKDGEGKRTGQDVFNAIARHYAANLEHKETPWQDRALALTSIQQLALNPAYHLQNSLQPIMVTVPRLAADFNNYSGAWIALRQGYAITREIVSGGFFTDTKIDLSKVKNEKLRNMLQSAADAGLLDVGLEEDLNKFEMTRTGYAAVDKTSAVGKTVVHKLRQVARRVEAYNRVSAAVAAYNMKHAQLQAQGITGDALENQSKEYAISVLQDTQGDFSKVDAPLIIKKLPKFMVQYRKFQLMMAAHYVKAARDAFAGESPEVRAIGRRALLISLGHAFAGAGFLGLPLMNLVGLAFKHMGDDDDEPRDFERFLREQIGDGDFANYLLHGPLWFMGMDAKLSQDKIFSILPYADWDLTSKKGVINLGAGLMGPSWSAGTKFAEGLGSIGKGDYYKGLAQVLPSGFGNAVHAFEVANKGYTLKNGDVMVAPEDVQTFQLLLDGLGLKSPEMRLMDWAKNQHWQVTQFYSDRTKEIERQYNDATKAGDNDALNDLRDQWVALQDGKDRLRYLFDDSHDSLKRQPLSNLLKYPQTVAKRERKLQQTVPRS